MKKNDIKNFEKEKKDIRISFASFTCKANKDVLLAMLKTKFNVIVDNIEYDYYFVDDVVYYYLINMQEVLNAKKDSIKIMLAYEAIFPDLNIFDYAISFVNKFDCQDRVLHLPYLEMLNMQGYGALIASIDFKSCLNDPVINKMKFCNFIYGNNRGHQMRERLFWKISEYKQVDSLGKFLNNVAIENTRENIDWLQKSIELKQKYKFSIAAENASFPGYTSEKIITSMLAGTIPIYWGNPWVADEYNDESFINVMQYDSLDEVVEVIKRLDEDEEAYHNMLLKPWRTEKQINDYNINVNKFYNAFYNIFMVEKEEAYRRPEGCWPDQMYPDFFYSSTTEAKERIIDRIKRMLS